MNFLKSLKNLTASAVILTGCLSSPSMASELEEHRELMKAIQRVGVSVYVNDLEHCDDDSTAGWYSSKRRMLVVCQDNSSGKSDRMVAWTANDYDTLRHESIHLLQDCKDGDLGDGKSLMLLKDGKQLLKFMRLTDIPMDDYRSIWKSYENLEYSEAMIVHEMEAFAMASSIDADVIAEKVYEFCVMN